MKKIEKLTSEQELALIEFKKKWFAIGSCAEPADRPRAEAAIAAMYARIEKPKPRFIWVDSPATAALAMTVLRDERLMSSLRSSLESSLWSSLRSSLESSLRSSLWSSLWSSLRSSLESSLESSRFWGQMEAYWVAFYLFPRDVLGVQYEAQRSAELDLWSEVAQSCGWWWPFDGLVIACERPKIIAWETDREPPRLHSDSGPAVLFRDGYYLHAWHGVTVPSRVIESPESYTAEEIKAERNAEVVRALAERLGWQIFLERLGATVIDTWRDKRTGLTYELLDTQRFGERQPRFLRMQSPKLLDGSSPWYIEKVHPELRTAKAARAWQFMKLDGNWPSVADSNKGIKTEFDVEA